MPPFLAFLLIQPYIMGSKTREIITLRRAEAKSVESVWDLKTDRLKKREKRRSHGDIYGVFFAYLSGIMQRFSAFRECVANANVARRWEARNDLARGDGGRGNLSFLINWSERIAASDFGWTAARWHMLKKSSQARIRMSRSVSSARVP